MQTTSALLLSGWLVDYLLACLPGRTHARPIFYFILLYHIACPPAMSEMTGQQDHRMWTKIVPPAQTKIIIRSKADDPMNRKR
jgi:hypothetical protein